MGTTSVIQHRASGAPVCTLCSSPSYASLRADLDAGVRVAQVAERYGVSIAAVYRHRRAAHDAVHLIAVDDTDGLTFADRLLVLFDRATMASEGLYAKGDMRGGSLVGDHALRAASALAALGLDRDAMKTELHKARDVRRSAFLLARTVEQAVELHPEITEHLALAAEAVGAVELAAQLREGDSSDAPDPDLATLEMSRA
jgi:hypothetical protein